DYFRKTGKYKKVYLWNVFFDPGLKFLYWFRKAQNSSDKSPLGIFYRIILRRYQIKYGFQISAKTQVDGGWYLGHWGTVVVTPHVKIGTNCQPAPGVTIGQTKPGDNAGVPQIGNHVWIGSNAVIVGGITIGNNVLLAPHSFVNHNIEDDSIVFGHPIS